MPGDDLLNRLRSFNRDAFPQYRQQFQTLVEDGQHPTTLFIGCSDSRLLPYLLTGAGPGELFLVRNVGAFVPPYDGSYGHHGTAAAIEFAVLSLHVERIVVCGHSHCGAIKALYEEVPVRVPADRLVGEPDKGWGYMLSGLQLERLMEYPMVRRRVAEGQISLHGWHYVIEDGEVHVFDVESGHFVAASVAKHSGTGPYHPYVEHDGQVLSDENP